MLDRLRPRLTYANVAATAALVLAMGGGAYAAVALPRNSVGTAQLKKGAVVASKVKPHSLLARDFKAGQLPAGAPGSPGARGPQGSQGERGETGQYPAVLTSGRTLTGTYALLGKRLGEADDRTSGPISFPIPLAAAPHTAVLVPASGPNPEPVGCPGTATAPAAAAGTLCVYEGSETNSSGTKVCRTEVEALCGPEAGGVSGRYGAAVVTFAVASGLYSSWGSWAVTAP